MICKLQKTATSCNQPAQYSPVHVVASMKAKFSLHKLHSVVSPVMEHVAQPEAQATTNVIGR